MLLYLHYHTFLHIQKYRRSIKPYAPLLSQEKTKTKTKKSRAKDKLNARGILKKEVISFCKGIAKQCRHHTIRKFGMDFQKCHLMR
jgi:hypothetical protein